MDDSDLDELRTLVLLCLDAVAGVHAEVKALRNPDPGAELLENILTFVGATTRWTVSELLDRADGPLNAALAGRTPQELGRELAALEGTALHGRQLVRKGKTAEGMSWAFAPPDWGE